MSSFDDFTYPDDFIVTKPDGSILELRGSVNGAEMYLVTSEDLTPKDSVVRNLSTGKSESYQIFDVQFLEAAAGSPDQQRVSVKRVFD